MKPRFTMREALHDQELLAATLDGPSWESWRVLLIAAMGERLRKAERKLFTKLTGRELEPLERVEELWTIVGRRGGKSRAKSVLATYLSGLCDHTDVLAPGERGILLCIAPDQRQASIVLDYCSAVFQAAPILKQLIANRTADTLELTNNITIEVRASNFRRLRGPTYIGVICDEAAFWRSDESANPDTEILNSVRPGLATTGGPLIVASSPYARKGELWNAYRRHYGSDGDALVLVAQGTSRDFNATLPQSVVDRALERDHAAASAEYLGQFRSDIESFISVEALAAVTSGGVFERARLDNTRYYGFCDPSGGSRDSFTLGIAHLEGKKAVLDCIREKKPPFSPEAVVGDFANVFKTYGIRTIRGDRYSGEIIREMFKKQGIEYRPCDHSKSEIYLGVLPAINSGLVDLLDDKTMLNQLGGLERRTARGGKDSVDHPPHGRDDVANSACGALNEALTASRRPVPLVGAGIQSFSGDRREPTYINHEFKSHRY